MKYLQFAAIMGLLLMLGVIGFRSVKTTIPVDDRMGSIVRLVDAAGRTYCSGVVVNDAVIITASHCVIIETPFGNIVNPEPVEIRDDSNVPTGVYARPFSARIQLDQALLRGDFTQFKHRKTMTGVGALNKEAKYDAHLISCGYPMGGPLHCSDMYFKELYDFMWSTGGLLLPGMSGGPVMLPDGTVVAVNVAVTHSTTDHQVSLVSPIYNIELLLRK